MSGGGGDPAPEVRSEPHHTLQDAPPGSSEGRCQRWESSGWERSLSGEEKGAQDPAPGSCMERLSVNNYGKLHFGDLGETA